MPSNKCLIADAGQSLFEVVVAIAVSALIIVAIVSLTTNSIRNASFSKNKTLAATYAQEASEWLRGQRDNDINTFATKAELSTAIDPKTLNVTWCLSDLSWTKPGPCSSTNVISETSFLRQVVFSLNNDISTGKTIFQVDVSVSWSDSQGVHVVTSSTNLSDWRQR